MLAIAQPIASSTARQMVWKQNQGQALICDGEDTIPGNIKNKINNSFIYNPQNNLTNL